MTAYEILGLPETASAADIAQTSRRLLAAHHPDKGGDAERFNLIARARDLIADPERRAAYDARLARMRAGETRPATVVRKETRTTVEVVMAELTLGDVQEIAEVLVGARQGKVDLEKAGKVASRIVEILGKRRRG